MTRDAQAVCTELMKHCNKSTKAEAECSCISDFLLNACVEEWPGSTFDFITHMHNQVQVCNEKSTTQISEAQEQKCLEQSVQNFPDLCQHQEDLKTSGN